MKSNQQIVLKETNNWRNLDSGVLINDDFGEGPTDLILEEENVPLVNLEGKKRQTVIEGLSMDEGNKMDE